ncbi:MULTISPECIES: hypothetical protein [Marivita]|uniref:Uncharacterized protein n=1 Tax=Marivita cryptomonadis TaxID=505252 RepID=A0A9Q2NWG5_9RHOB|nr:MULTISPECIES: hypothetical protein [Marivita]MCR9168730.1 hypothetical protein [Paracoccaceae bacterium]MBM2321019.1 hypothetical protein [Marivita cryptomonadis]MBM2330600.1 hypothetical protein [Marivita cryptomonadis]MBM2340186.1 hypothetical protein [Marivita cryptomonadis]MBM2344848.1 hypothetical protein [Marivita cryptomonadis]
MDYITDQNMRYMKYWEERNVFFESLCASEQHWFFVQGYDAYIQELYLPSLSSLLNGIEATLRITLYQMDCDTAGDLSDLSPYRVLSNKLILQANNFGLEVKYLSFNEEMHFFENLNSAKPNLRDVEIVRLRNNICHGNITDFINRDLGVENSYFSPEMLKETTEKVLAISADWCEMLGRFRRKNGLLNYDTPSADQIEKDLFLYDKIKSDQE